MNWTPGLLNTLCSAIVAQKDKTFWMPPQASTTATDVDTLFYFIYGLSVFFFVLIVGAMFYFIFKYRRRAGVQAEKTASHSLALELTWTIIPLILVLVIFYMGFTGYMNMSTPPLNALEIKVIGQRWKWLFEYPGGYIDESLHVPVDRPVKLVMRSSDVIHSMYIPAFRLKKDVIPGRYTYAWFEATEPTPPGQEHIIFCAEYCGTSHSDMLSLCYVHEPGGFEKWLREASDFLSRMPPAEAGAKLFKVNACAQCHSIDGTAGKGPTLKDAFGKEETMADGSTVRVDENYIVESIKDPKAKVVAGYQPIMPTYQGRIKDSEIDAIIQYIKQLSGIEPRLEPFDSEKASEDENGDN